MIIAWCLGLLLAILCFHLHRQLKRARADARRVRDLTVDGLRQLDAQIRALEHRAADR